MNSPRFYCGAPLVEGIELLLPDDVLHHAVRVRRLGVGDALTLFNGKGGEYDCSLTLVDKRCAKARVNRHLPVEREAPLAVHLWQGLSAAEKMDLTVQKAVELGVASVRPLATARAVVQLRGERAEKRVQHWRQVVASACEQCGRNTLPPVHDVQTLEQALAAPPPSGARRWLFSPRGTCHLRNSPRPDGDLILLAGPEAGLSPEEEAAAIRAGFEPITFGPRILRTETAALAALAAIQALWGDC